MKREIPKPNIVDVLEALGGQVVGADRGGWRKARCPLHEDRSPSASVNEDECRFNCFSCDFNGDAVDLIMKVENAEWSDALARAASFPGGSDDGLRGEPASSRGVSAGSRGGRRKSGPWTPPWSL